MGVVLPNELVWVLGAIGVTWPNIDEDELRRAGDEFRKLSAELSAHKSGAMGEIEQMLGVNSSESLKVFQALWDKVVKGHLSELMEAVHAWARQNEYESVRMECHNQHRPMLHLAIANGYDIVGMRWDPDRGDNLVIFEKVLTG